MNEWAEAATVGWGYAILLALVLSTAFGALFWIGHLIVRPIRRRRRQQRARRRFTEEALVIALDDLGRRYRASIEPIGRALLPPMVQFGLALKDLVGVREQVRCDGRCHDVDELPCAGCSSLDPMRECDMCVVHRLAERATNG